MVGRILYFQTDKIAPSAIEAVERVIRKQKLGTDDWKFSTNRGTHEAVLEYEEEMIKDIKLPRRLAVRFATKETSEGVAVAVEFRAKSDFHSFSCKGLAQNLVKELKKELREVAA